MFHVHRTKKPVFICEKKPIFDERMNLSSRGLYALICARGDEGKEIEDLKDLKEMDELIEFGYMKIEHND